MKTDYKKIHKSAEQLRKTAERLDQFHAKKKPTRTGELSKRDAATLERLEQRFVEANVAVKSELPSVTLAAAASLTAAAPPAADPAARFDFDAFFAEIADGFVNAQSKLDVASAQYLKQVSVQPHVLPSVFRMPKLNADLKFALEKKEGKAIQLLFFKNESTTTNLNEQSVHFEIVAAPPPVGMLVAPVSVFPLFSKSRRTELFKLIQEFLLPPPNNTAAKTDSALDRKNLIANPDRVIIISVDGDRRFLLAVADNAAAGNVGFWYLDTEDLSLSVLRKFGSPSDPNIGRVADFVFKLGGVQKDFLAKLP
jgi:hypothetical protein